MPKPKEGDDEGFKGGLKKSKSMIKKSKSMVMSAKDISMDAFHVMKGKADESTTPEQNHRQPKNHSQALAFLMYFGGGLFLTLRPSLCAT